MSKIKLYFCRFTLTLGNMALPLLWKCQIPPLKAVLDLGTVFQNGCHSEACLFRFKVCETGYGHPLISPKELKET